MDELPLHKPVIEAVSRFHELSVGTRLNDAPLIHNDDAVRTDHG